MIEVLYVGYYFFVAWSIRTYRAMSGTKRTICICNTTTTTTAQKLLQTSRTHANLNKRQERLVTVYHIIPPIVALVVWCLVEAQSKEYLLLLGSLLLLLLGRGFIIGFGLVLFTM